jgi:integrase
MGTYPKTGLALARQMAEEARQTLAEGIDPSHKRKDDKAAVRATWAAEDRVAKGLPPLNAFETLARDWFEVRRGSWATSYSQKIIERLERDVFPWLGRTPVTAITPPMLLEVLRRIEARGVVETAHRALDNCSQIFRYGIAIGHADNESSLRPEGRAEATAAEALRRDHGARAARASAARLRRLCRHPCGARRVEVAADAPAPTRRVAGRGVERDRPRQRAMDRACGAA